MGIRKYYWKVIDFLSDSKKKPVSVIASRNGQLFELRDLFIGRLVTPARDIHELDDIKTGFEFKLPKIPGEHLEKIISFFRDYWQRYDTEVMVHIYYDNETDSYVLDCPQQLVNKYAVHSNPKPLDPKRYTKIMDIHSHNSMEAYFSHTDNADEVNPLLFGVVGTLHKDPTMVFRVGLNGFYLELPASYLFTEFDGNNHLPYPTEWEERVVVKERFSRERNISKETRI